MEYKNWNVYGNPYTDAKKLYTNIKEEKNSNAELTTKPEPAAIENTHYTYAQLENYFKRLIKNL